MIAIDFFCGGGGMTRGLINAGIDVLAGIDSNPNCCKTYEKNNNSIYIKSDITKLSSQDLLAQFPQLRNTDDLLLVGCAPCQPFSILRREEFDDNGNALPHKSVNLLVEFGRFVKDMHPAHVLVENVPGLKGKGREVLENFKSMLNKEGYAFAEKIIYAKDYGVPQNRRRYVLIASRIFQPQIPNPQYGKGLLPYKTVREAIGKYPAISAGEENAQYANHKSANLKPILETQNAIVKKLDIITKIVFYKRELRQHLMMVVVERIGQKDWY